MTAGGRLFGHFIDMCAVRIVACAAVFFALIPTTFADDPLRPMNPSELDQEGLTVDEGVPVEGAQVAWANYPLIRRDFPQIAHFTDRQIDAWLIRNFAYIGAKQHLLKGVRSTDYKVDRSRPTKKIYRQKTWVRSGTMEALSESGDVIGMIDVKGVGLGDQTSAHFFYNIERQLADWVKAIAEGDQKKIDEIRNSPYSNGLVSLGESIAELTRQQAIQKILEYRRIALETVETYAVMSSPVGIMKEGNTSITGGFYLRQSQRGRGGSLPAPSDIYFDPEGNNQHTASRAIVDMGGVDIRDP
ncbi:MAG: hypothetical protein ABL958_15725 [Bdellovibrionia bacterium]